MLRHFKITVDGRDYDVTVEEITGDPGNLYPDKGSMTAAAAASADTVAPAAARPPAGARFQAGPGDVVSPLAGIVVAVEVALGDEVRADTRVATLEAMKTKTVVTAGRAGKVSAIAVAAGDAVDADQPLLTIA